MTETKGRVLVVTAHPDDPEFAAGGTIAKLVKEGREVAYAIATNGNKGSGDRSMTPERLAKIREEEQRNAARALDLQMTAARCHLSQVADFAELEARFRKRAAAIGKPHG
jgi:LmbE family N-acetylglucosaminyl deacetylase